MAEKESVFLQFLLIAPRVQVSALLQHLTPGQLSAVCEVFLNVLQGEIEPTILHALKPHRLLIRRIGNRASGPGERKGLISRHPHTVVKVLRLVESILP